MLFYLMDDGIIYILEVCTLLRQKLDMRRNAQSILIVSI